ncbi:MAG: tetratricopeptide repeat protein [bacterium]|nr:tetratricopeptide repeat protein [bacterium]
MKKNDYRNAISIALLLPMLYAMPACRKTEPQTSLPGGDAVRLSDSSEIDSYKEILKKDPNNLQALINIGNRYYDSGQDRPAVDAYKRALGIDPANADVRVDMAISLRRLGDTDGAIEELKKAISVNARHAQARYNLGVILVNDKKDIPAGIKAWEGLLENIPDFPDRERLKADIERLKASASQAGGMQQK